MYICTYHAKQWCKNKKCEYLVFVPSITILSQRVRSRCVDVSVVRTCAIRRPNGCRPDVILLSQAAGIQWDDRALVLRRVWCFFGNNSTGPVQHSAYSYIRTREYWLGLTANCNLSGITTRYVFLVRSHSIPCQRVFYLSAQILKICYYFGLVAQK